MAARAIWWVGTRTRDRAGSSGNHLAQWEASTTPPPPPQSAVVNLQPLLSGYAVTPALTAHLMARKIHYGN